MDQQQQISIATDEHVFLRLIVNREFDMNFFVDSLVILIFILILSALILVRFATSKLGVWRTLELDEAQFGLGNQKITLKPNAADRQIAYQIWVELNTRKVGLPLDLNNDVIDDVYSSWYSFFGVTRDLIKEIPASKFRRVETERLVRLSIDILNVGVRPHLTEWQARFRRWYQKALTDNANVEMAPQDIQKMFPFFNELQEDLLKVNSELIMYRKSMYQIVKAS